MTLPAEILPIAAFLADEESTPVTRWQAVNRHASSIHVDPWWVGFWLLMALVCCTVGVLVYRAIRRRLEFRRHLGQVVGRLRLSGVERDLLVTLAKHSGLRNSHAVFSAGEAFDHAAAIVNRLPRVQALSETARQQIRGLIESLRNRLGFAPDAGGDDGRIQSSRQIPVGERLVITRSEQTEPVEALVERNTAADMIVRPGEGFHARRGDSLVVQYSRGRLTWEMTAPVVDSMGDRLVVGHTSQIRLINRRRFVRVRLRCHALIGPVPFEPAQEERPAISMSQADLVEIAGPGLVLECGLKANPDESLLVRILFDDASIQAVARIRRVEPVGPDRFRLAVEMTSLDPDEVGELVRRTQQAQYAAATVAAAATPVPAVTAAWRSDNG